MYVLCMESPLLQITHEIWWKWLPYCHPWLIDIASSLHINDLGKSSHTRRHELISPPAQLRWPRITPSVCTAIYRHLVRWTRDDCLTLHRKHVTKADFIQGSWNSARGQFQVGFSFCLLGVREVQELTFIDTETSRNPGRVAMASQAGSKTQITKRWVPFIVFDML